MRLLSVLLLLPLIAVADDDRETVHNDNGWYMYFGDHPFGKSKWGVHLEGQWRRSDVITRWQQLLLRPGINYTVSQRLMLTAGYAFIQSYPYGNAPTGRFATPEHRLWEQALLRYRTGKLGWSTRIRFENRFLGVVGTESPEVQRYRYENRLRLMQRVSVPVSKDYYVAAYDEFWTFIKPYQSNSAFDQNRAYIALGRKFGPHWDLEAGYMNQAVLQRSGRVLESNHTLMISITSRMPFNAD